MLAYKRLNFFAWPWNHSLMSFNKSLLLTPLEPYEVEYGIYYLLTKIGFR